MVDSVPPGPLPRIRLRCNRSCQIGVALAIAVHSLSPRKPPFAIV